MNQTEQNQDTVNYYAAPSQSSGLWHATTSNDQSKQVKTLCGIKVWNEYTLPTARIINDYYWTPNSQWVECEKCERALQNAYDAEVEI